MLRIFFMALVLAGTLTPIAAAQGGADEARREALRTLRGDQELAAARTRWPRYERAIALEIPKQDKVVQAGGSELDDRISNYELKADLSGEPVDCYLAGRILGLAGRLDQARAYFERSVAVDRFFYWGHHGLGTYFAMREMPEPAAKHYQESLDLNPEFMKAARGLAMCHMQMRNYDRAETMFRRIIAKQPDDLETRRAFARMLMSANRYAEAVNALLELKQRAGDQPGIDTLLAFCYARTDDVEKAIELYEAQLERDPKDFRSALEVGRILMRLGRHHDAADRFQAALEHLPLQAPIDRAQLEELIADLRAGPPIVKQNEKRKDPNEIIQIMLNSAEVERRREAARMLAASPIRHPELDKAFLRALKDADYVVRTVAVRTVGEWWGEAEQLSDPRLVRIFSILLNDRSHLVRGMVAGVLGRADHARAVPPLMKRLARERDPYVFRQIHRALNRLSFAYIGIPLEGELDTERMEKLSAEWRTWYDANAFLYRKYEEN